MSNMPKEEFIVRMMMAIFGQESNRNYAAYNDYSGAGGAYQFMPETWDEWAKAAGYGEWAGTHPSAVPPEVQDVVVYYKFSDLYDAFKSRGASDDDMALYMPNSHYGRHDLGLDHYDQGFLPTEMEKGGYPSQYDYCHSVYNKFWEITPDQIQTSGLTHLMTNGGAGMKFYSGGHMSSEAMQGRYMSPFGEEIPVGVNAMGDFYDSLAQQQYENWDIRYNQPTPQPLSFLEGVTHGFEQSTFGQWWMRPSGKAGDAVGSYFPDDSTLAYVNSLFPDMDRGARNEKIARILSNATSEEHLFNLIAYEKERDDRAYRADAQDYISIGALGSLIGSIFNPVNLVPYVGWAGKLGAAGRVISSGVFQKAARAAWVGAQTGALNIADSYGAHKIGGTEFNPALAFAGGMMAGTGLSLFGELAGNLVRRGIKPSETLQHSIDALDNIETRYAHTMAGYPDPMLIPVSKEQLRPLADHAMQESTIKAKETLGIPVKEESSYSPPSLERKTKGEALAGIEKETDRLMKEQGGVYIAPMKQIEHFADRAGIELPKNMRAMFVRSLDTVLVNGDSVKSAADLRGLVSHEMMIHRGLQTAPKDMYDSLMKAVLKKTKKPKGVWLEAMKHARSDDPEEILAHAVELQLSKGKPLPQLPELTSVLKHLMGDKNLSQKKLTSTMHEIADRIIMNAKGYSILPDGSAVVDGVRFSADNPVVSHLYDKEVVLPSDAQEGFTKDLGAPIAGTLRGIAGNKYVGTDFGKMAFSTSPTLRDITKHALIDPYQGGMRGREGRVVAEQVKNHVVAVLQKYDSDYIANRAKALGNSIMNGRLTFASHDDAIIDFNTKAVLLHDILHGAYSKEQIASRMDRLGFEVTPELKRAADILYEKWQASVSALKDTNIDAAKAEGILDEKKLKDRALLTKDFMPLDESFTRAVDPRKRTQVMNDTAFGSSANEVRAFFKKYWLGAMSEKEAANIERFWQDVEHEAHPLHKELDEALRAVSKEKKTEEGSETLRERAAHMNWMPQEAYAKWKDKEAEHWAAGITDHDMSRESPDISEHLFNGDDKLESRLNAGEETRTLPFLRRRSIGDTSFEMAMPDGKMFSFDRNLRDYDVDGINLMQTNMTAGEIGFKHVFNDDQSFINTAAKVRTELNKAMDGVRDSDGKWHKLSKDKADDIYQTFLRDMSALRGRPLTERIAMESNEGRWGFGLGMLQKGTYTAVGGNLGFNQMAELIGAVSEAGPKLLPKYVSYILRGSDGDIDEQAAYEFAKSIGYQEFSQLPQQRLLTAREFMQQYGHTVTGRALLTVDKGLNAGNRLMSMLNMMPALTRTMTDCVRGACIRDLQHLARGEETTIFNKLLEEDYLKEAGITPEKLQAVYRDVNKYLPENLSKEQARTVWKRWQRENPTTFFAVQKIMEDTSARALTKTSIGTTNSWFRNAPMRRLLGFFMNFTFMASHAQTLRMMNRPAYALAAATVFGGIAGLAGYGAVSAVNSYVKYPLDAKKREEYMKRRFSARPLILAALTRGAFLSPLAYMTNIGGALGIEGTDIRTTTGNRAIRSQGMYQQAAGQFPVLNFINSAAYAADNLYEQGLYTLSAGRYGYTMSQASFAKTQGALPFGNWMGTQLLLHLLEHTLDIPDKPKKGTEVVKEEKAQRKQQQQQQQRNPKERK